MKRIIFLVCLLLSPFVYGQEGDPELLIAARQRLQEGRYKKCISLSNKVLVKWPHMAEAYYLKGRAYEALKKPLEAANEYNAALMAQKEFDDAQQGLNRVLVQLGSGSEATP